MARILEEKVTFFDALFGCWHKRMSFPLTSRRGQRRPEAAAETGTYVVCLDCGKEFAYDWQTMQMKHPRKQVAYGRATVEAKAS
jgi:ribosomal protein L32